MTLNASKNKESVEPFPDSDKIIVEIKTLFGRLFPICRSLTGDGVRQTLEILKSVCDFNINSVASGTQVFDWIVPEEWNIEDAYIADKNGSKVVSFKENNIHVVNYSTAIDSVLTFDQLRPHLHTLPELPLAIPYRTTYYKKEWGFCLSQDQLERMDTTIDYQVLISSSHKPGVLNFGEHLIPGNSGQEYLISTYCCHPSLANDNLSGMVLWIFLLRWLKSIRLKEAMKLKCLQ